MRNGLLGVGFTCLLLAVLFALPVKFIQDFRNDTAYKFVQSGQWEFARLIYAIGAQQSDPLAVNNFHVLNYRRAIDGEGLEKAKRKEIAAAAKADFERLIGEGFTAAAYNRGMFNYKCGTKNSCYHTAVNHFTIAANAGDEMSQDALDFMLAKKFKKETHYEKIRQIADRGNSWAAHRYAKSLRFDRDKLKANGKPYAEMAARAGIADAQDFLGSYFEEREDSAYWLERAATNPVNRSLTAASELAYRAKENGDYETARHWYKIAAKPRADFDYNLVVREDGLRWRDHQSSRLADVNNSKSAAYDLARLFLEGKGGKVNKRKAKKYLIQADDWADAKLLLATMDDSKAGAKMVIESSLETFDKNATKERYEDLRPYIANGIVRYVTETELETWQDRAGASGTKTSDKNIERALGRCWVQLNCFYVTGSIRLPEGMAGADAGIFFVRQGGKIDKPENGHNLYVNVADL